MRHPEKSKDIQFYLFGQTYVLRKTHKKMDATVQAELFSILPECMINQCMRQGYGYKAELSATSRRHLHFLKETLDKLPQTEKQEIVDVIRQRKTNVIAHLIDKLYQVTTGENGYKTVSPMADDQTMANEEQRLDGVAKYPYATYTQTPKGRKFIFNKLFHAAITVHMLLEKDLNAFLKQVEKADKNMVWDAVQKLGVDVMTAVFTDTVRPLTAKQVHQKEPIPDVRYISNQKQIVKE